MKRMSRYVKCLIPEFRIFLLTENVISDVWVIWERISQKLIFWRHGWEAWVRSGDLGNYLGFLAGDFFFGLCYYARVV